MNDPKLSELVAEIRAIAADLKINPAELTRARFREVSPLGTSRFAGHHWGQAKALASGDALPLSAVPEGHVVKGVSTLIGKDGRTKNQWVKTQALAEDPTEMILHLAERLEAAITPKDPAPEPAGGLEDVADLLAVYPLGDMHLGMYAAAREAGDAWDTAAAMKIARSAISDLTEHGPPAAHGLLINVGDFFHSDNPQNRTAKSGNPLDVDGRYFEIMEKGLELKTDMIDRMLTVHRTVRVWVRLGNHDEQSSLGLAIALRAYYRNDPRVLVEINPAPADYLRWGNCLIGCTHGDTYAANKPNQMVAIMANDRPQDWGQTLYRYWYVGHVHHKNKRGAQADQPGTQSEGTGAIVETFRTLAAKDAWHTAQGYRAGRDMNRILLHKLDGEVSRITTSVGRLRRLYA